FVLSADASNTAGGGTPLNIPLTSVVVTGPTHGTLDLKLDGSFTFTPEKDFFGSDVFTYRAVMSPPPGSTTPPTPNPISHDVATVTLNIKANNTPPVAHNDFYAVLQDTTLTVAAPGVLNNDTRPTGHQLAVSLGDNTTNGILTLNADGSFVYSPKSGFFGYDKFTYKVTDITLAPTTADNG